LFTYTIRASSREPLSGAAALLRNVVRDRRLACVQPDEQSDAGADELRLKDGGVEDIAKIQQFTESAKASGQFVITFTSVTNNTRIEGAKFD